jgi:putative tricarboxylic transport membrane protein
MRTTKCLGVLAAAAALALAVTPALSQGYPSKRLDWTIAFGPGGGNDIMSRTLISILE